jgi:hypothetical protein
MPSAQYRLFRRAILGRKQIICNYRGFHRELCPHVLGHTHGKETALTYQFAGQSSSGLPADGDWRCLVLTEVRSARLRDGGWHTGNRHTATQACVDIVDVDVNL